MGGQVEDASGDDGGLSYSTQACGVVVSSLAEYEAAAVALCSEPGLTRLRAMQAAVRRNRWNHPLFDTAAYERLPSEYRKH
jgi:hypothetical protein